MFEERKSNRLIKRLYLLVLLLLFLLQFKECMVKYISKKIVQDVSIDQRKFNRIPPVTICLVPGLKHPIPNKVDASIGYFCQERTDYVRCLEDLFWNMGSILETVQMYKNDSNSQLVLREWVPTIMCGRCLTVELDELVKATFNDAIMVQLGLLNGSYSVAVHGRKQFVPGFKVSSSFVPVSFLGYRPVEYTYYDLSIAVQHKTNLNTEERPCVDDEDYSVEDCLESFFQETIGCRLPWSHLNNSMLPLCKTKEEFDKLVSLHLEVSWMSSPELVDLTRCRAPCKTVDFRIRQEEYHDRYTSDGKPTLLISLQSADEEVIRETYFYDFNSLVAEVGGSLGLFLGFSLVTASETVIETTRNLFKKAQTICRSC